MPNVIAVIWDFDKTLVDGYMQDPIFKEYKINPKEFWEDNNKRADELATISSKDDPLKANLRVNKDTFYLNTFIRLAREGTFKGLNNNKLQRLGGKLRFYPGVKELFQKTKKIAEEAEFKEYDIHVEHYIVSTGMAAIIRGSKIYEDVDGIWGCELLDDETGDHIDEVIYSIDNTSKTRAIFEINKGVGKLPNIDVNTSIPLEERRVQFENMIYIADGPSDIPAFSVVNQRHGATFAIYPQGDDRALKQVEKMRMDGRVNMYAEADYSEKKPAHMWICNKIREFATRICENERKKHIYSPGTPQHLL